MTVSVYTREGLGRALTWDEGDANFENLATEANEYLFGSQGDATALAPSATEDGYAVVWDNTAAMWTLAASTGGGFESEILTADVNIDGAATYGVQFGVDSTDGTTGNDHTLDVFGAYAQVIDIQGGSQGGDYGYFHGEDGYVQIGYSGGGYLKYDIDGAGNWELRYGINYNADYSGASYISDRSIMDKGYIDSVGFVSKVLTEDVNISGAETYDIRFGANTDGSTGDAYRIDTFAIYGENLVTFECGPQSGDRMSVAMIPALNIMQIGAFNSSSQLTGLQWGSDALDVYFTGTKLFDFSADTIEAHVDFHMLDDSDNSILTTDVSNDGSESQPKITLHDRMAVNGELMIDHDHKIRYRIDGETTSSHSEQYNSSSAQFEIDYYGETHELWNMDELNWYFDTTGSSNTWTIYDGDPTDTPSAIFTLTDAGALTISGDLTAANVFAANPSTITGLDLAQTVGTGLSVIPLSTTQVGDGGNDYTINLASNQIDFDGADGAKIFEVSVFCRYDLQDQGTGGSTRSYASMVPRLNGANLTQYSLWTYIREFQGATNGVANNSGAITFQIQPALNDALDFRVQGITDTGTLTDFEIDAIVVTIKRLE
jgi:hypothetical protein